MFHPVPATSGVTLPVRLWRFVGTAFFLVTWACSPRPSTTEMKAAITESLKERVPMSWAGSLMGGTNVEIEFVEIQKVGRFNKDGQYWPVKARVRGTCMADLLVSKEPRAFDKIADFHLQRDDYGEWHAETQHFQ